MIDNRLGRRALLAAGLGSAKLPPSAPSVGVEFCGTSTTSYSADGGIETLARFAVHSGRSVIERD